MSRTSGALTRPEGVPRIGSGRSTDLPPRKARGHEMTAYISQNAFWGLLISAVEVYKRECFGLLIGYRDQKEDEDRYIIEHAVPYQTAGRRHKGVVSNPRAHKRIERFLANIPQLSVIGDFHSHTMWGYSKAANALSQIDLEG